MAQRPLAVFGRALRRSGAGTPVRLRLVTVDGTTVRDAYPLRWSGDLLPGDDTMLARCTGPTLDLGCGPGRLTVALTSAGQAALGVDLSAEAVRQARRRGANAVLRCVFDPLPGEGRWQHVLLADGNVGIGGDPERLLARCRCLLRPGGDVLVEVDPPGVSSWERLVRLCDGESFSEPFAWAAVGADRITALAARVELRLTDVWETASRWFARLER